MLHLRGARVGLKLADERALDFPNGSLAAAAFYTLAQPTLHLAFDPIHGTRANLYASGKTLLGLHLGSVRVRSIARSS